MNYKNNYHIVKIKIKEKELESINNYNVIKNNTYNNYNDFNGLYNELINFLKLSGDCLDIDIKIMSKYICKIVKNVLLKAKKDGFWFTIRTFLPTEEHKIPRWHQDGKYYNSNDDNNKYKFVATIKGNGTIYCQPNEDKLIEFYKIKNEIDKEMINLMNDRSKFQMMFEKEKNAMYELFKNIKVKQIKKNHGLYFKVGTNDALIHSEPNIVEQRVFISILTGTVEQINEYKLKRMNF
jgi:hypothetical protein